MCESSFESLQEIAGDSLLSSREEYINERTLLKFNCISCNVYFTTTHFLYKQKKGNQCIQCKQLQNNSVEQYIQQVQEKFGRYYDYSKLMNDGFNSSGMIIITCPEHGDLEVSTSEHLLTFEGCKHCKINSFQHKPSKQYEFIMKAHHVHNFKYNYDDVIFIDENTPINVRCSKHGTFSTAPLKHINDAEGCPSCSAIYSSCNKITLTLDQLNISYSTSKIFSECIGTDHKSLPFDIFIPRYNLCVDINETFNIQQSINYQIKNDYCENNNIDYIQILCNENNPDEMIRTYIEQLSPQRVTYNWNDFNIDVYRIINYIKTFNYSKFAVYGVLRGGIPMAVCISNHFDGACEFGIVKFQRYNGDDKIAEISVHHPTPEIPIFVIDDLISSGITMDKAVNKLTQTYPSSIIHPIVIFGNENNKGIFNIRDHPMQWVIFPYEL